MNYICIMYAKVKRTEKQGKENERWKLEDFFSSSSLFFLFTQIINHHNRSMISAR